METKHTPGPWEYRPEPEQPNPYWHQFKVSFGSAGIMEGASHDRHGQGAHNARLIAAAPDLLAALEEIIAEAEGGWLRQSLIAKRARAAIAKAKGEA